MTPEHLLSEAMLSWYESKLLLEDASALTNDMLHVLAGAGLWTMLILASRRGATSWLPWLCVLVVIFWNEAVDIWIDPWPDPGPQYNESIKDVILTVAVPTALMFSAKLRQRSSSLRG